MKTVLNLPVLKNPVTGKIYLAYKDHMLSYTIARGMLRNFFAINTGLSPDTDKATFNLASYYSLFPELRDAVLDKMICEPADRADIIATMLRIEAASEPGREMFIQEIRDYYAAAYSYDFGGIDSLYAETSFRGLSYALAEKIDIDAFIGDEVEIEVREAIFSRLAKMLSCTVEDLYLTWVYGYKR